MHTVEHRSLSGKYLDALIFRRRSIHYPAYYTAAFQNKKLLNTVCLFTITIRSVDQQRNSHRR